MMLDKVSYVVHEKEEMVEKRLSRHKVANSTCSLKVWTDFELMLTARMLT
jgi:hypothetical protein